MNIFQKRLDDIEEKNKKNNFKNIITKITRKGSKIIDSIPFHYESFNVNGNWHSINNEKEKFTNFLRSYGTNKHYEILVTLFDKIYNTKYNVLDDFELDENMYSNESKETKRLKRIIMNSNNIKIIEDVPQINELIPIKRLKEKEKRYKWLRLFVNIRDNGCIDLYLLDIYHLGINAFDFETQSYNLNRNYSSNKDCNKCISKIVDDCIEKD